VLLGQRELPAEHPLVKLEQQRLLTGKGPEKRAWRHARGAGDLRGRRAPISLFQKQLYGGARSIFCCVKSPLACLPRSSISITLLKVYL